MEKDPLSALHDIHLPQPGGFWPPAPGWWLVALVALVLVAGAVMLVLRRRRRNRWLRQALRELDLTGFSQLADQQQLVELNQLIKRAARARYPDQHPESLSGERWIGFLVQTCPGQGADHEQTFRQLVQSSWRREAELSPEQARQAVRIWLRGQRC
ncbi:MAG: DUF4381 domain-containing protein [Marinobacter sp.]|nr:DUF4381 domain-containing protein [Marinobacter sp.]